MSSKKSKQKLYKVTLSKTFTYPSCVIDAGNSIRDLHSKSVADFLSHIQKNGMNASELEFKLDSELPFKIRTSRNIPKVEGTTSDGYDLNHVLRELAISELEKQYGPFDPEKSPHLYEYEPRVRWESNPDLSADEDEIEVEIEGEGDYYLKDEIELQLSRKIAEYSMVFKRKRL